jgi:hypothetical protein
MTPRNLWKNVFGLTNIHKKMTFETDCLIVRFIAQPHRLLARLSTLSVLSALSALACKAFLLFRSASRGSRMATQAARPMPNRSKMDWMAKRTVMEVLMDYDATLFGGAVRDWYLHDTHAAIFYDHMKNKNASYAETMKAYNDPSVLPETLGRITTPRDIDATLPEAQLAPMLKALERRGFHVRFRFNRNPRNYIANMTTNEGDLEHYCYTIQYMRTDFNATLRRCFPTWVSSDPAMQTFIQDSARLLGEMFGEREPEYAFNIDLMVQKEGRNLSHLDPPFGCVDFECNALLMDKRGMRMSRSLCLSSGSLYSVLWNRPADYDRLYREVLKRITNQHAVVLLPPADHPLIIPPMTRIHKMLKKGWIVDGFRTVDVRYEPNYEGHCLICHDDVGARHYKMTCCDARFHFRCLSQAMTAGDRSLVKTSTCFMCKNTRSSLDFQIDRDLLGAIDQYLENAKKPQTNADALVESGWLMEDVRNLRIAPLAPLPLAPPPMPLVPLPPMPLMRQQSVGSEYSVEDEEE